MGESGWDVRRGIAEWEGRNTRGRDLWAENATTTQKSLFFGNKEGDLRTTLPPDPRNNFEGPIYHAFKRP